MCGICASLGEFNQIPLVVQGLKKLDYRGYDACGIGFFINNDLKIVKSVGQIKKLEKKLVDFKSNIVIGHTRWATHGVVNEINAHPHISQDGEVALVHNGIIENYRELKQKIGGNFYSQTDTEIIANLISKKTGTNIEKLISACKELKGSFALAVLFKNDNQIYLAKRNSPLFIANGKNCIMAGSDLGIFNKKFDEYYCLEDDEFAVLNLKKIIFYNQNCKKIDKKHTFFDNFDFSENKIEEKYYMLKEIKEQPNALRKTFFEYFSKSQLIDINNFKNFNSYHFIACGTAYHSCLLGAKFFQHYLRKKVSVSIASEFRYDDNILSKSCLYIFVSQSGETADTIACAKLIKEKGFKTLAVTNVPFCSLNGIVDYVLPTFAGREVAVASTKAYTTQVYTLLIFALTLSELNNQDLLKKFALSYKVQFVGDDLIKNILKFKKIFFIGRQQDYITSLEASLKLKEIAYINCIGIAGGELKHGTLALIDEDTLVIVISTIYQLKEKTESNIQEIKARGGKILLVSQFKHDIDYDYSIILPSYEECFMPIVSIVPLQYLAFSFSVKLGFNPDKPRNLAKAVTVE